MTIQYSDSCKKKLYKIATTVAKQEAKAVSKHLTQYAKKSIGEFYDDYIPDIYKRTNTLRRKSYHEKYEPKPKEVITPRGKSKVYYGGVEFAFYEPVPYYQPPNSKDIGETVLELTIKHGLHGRRKNQGTHGKPYIPIQTLPTPWNRVLRERNRLYHGKSNMKTIKAKATNYALNKYFKR